MTEVTEIIPFEATHPGELIRDELSSYDGLTQKSLAKQLGVKPSYLNEVIQGKRVVNADLAIGLEKIFGIKSEYWLKLQSQFDLDRAKCEKRNIERLKNIDLWNVIQDYVPVKEFEKMGFFKKSIGEDIAEVLQIFDCSNVDGIIQKSAESRIHCAYKKSEKLQIDEKNIFAWSHLAKYEAKKQTVGTYRRENIPSLVKKLNECFFLNQNTMEGIRDILNNYGIKFVIVKKFKKAPIDGMSFWSGKNPGIAVSLRHNKLDILAFTIMHELGHIKNHMKSSGDDYFIDLNGDFSIGAFEEEANQFAENSLIPKKYISILKQKKITDKELIEIAQTERINPIILHGRHCFLTNNYRRRTKISHQIN